MASNSVKKAFYLDLPQHKRAKIDDSAQDVLQVIGAGLPRSGTTSLKAALEILGFDPCHHMSELFDHPKKSLLFKDILDTQLDPSPDITSSRLNLIKLQMRGYAATVDSPGCDIYRELSVLYPKAKVVLSVRDSDEVWWKSFSSTIGIQEGKLYEWLTYPIPFLRNNEILFHALARRWMRIAKTSTIGPNLHRAHNSDVQRNVPSERLLVFNIKMGWEPLCEFLDVPVPEQPFPNLNDAKMISRLVMGAQLMGLCVWLLYLVLAGLLMYVAFWPNFYKTF